MKLNLETLIVRLRKRADEVEFSMASSRHDASAATRQAVGMTLRGLARAISESIEKSDSEDKDSINT